LRAPSLLTAWGLAACLLSSVPVVGIQSQGQDAKEEVLEKLDPYTRGEKEALEKAGYVSLGPFEWAEGLRTDDVKETLGAGEVLWVETAHFKVGSTLQSYRFHNDNREEKAIDAELARLKPKLERYQPPKNKIDPWLRLHLYAQRLEEIYSDFTAQFGFSENEGTARKGAPKPGDPAHPAPPQKLRVLLMEKTSSLARFVKRCTDRDAEAWDRFLLPGGSMCFGVSSEAVRNQGTDLDAALRCVVADEVTRCLIDGFAGSSFTCPLWFEYGLAHVAARRVDERFVPNAGGAMKIGDDDSAKWEARVRGLVQNGAAPTWREMVAWQKWDEIKTQGHLVVWSRVAWLLKRKPAELQTFLLGIARPPPDRAEDDHSRISKEQQNAAVKAAFGKSFEDLDAQWKRVVAH
jgi:hypothetical protein